MWGKKTKNRSSYTEIHRVGFSKGPDEGLGLERTISRIRNRIGGLAYRVRGLQGQWVKTGACSRERSIRWVRLDYKESRTENVSRPPLHGSVGLLLVLEPPEVWRRALLYHDASESCFDASSLLTEIRTMVWWSE